MSKVILYNVDQILILLSTNTYILDMKNYHQQEIFLLLGFSNFI